jgi:hypothetical protein
MIQTEADKEVKTRISCTIPFFPENRAVYDIMRKNIVEPDRPQMTTQCYIEKRRVLCRITEEGVQTHTLNI